MEEKYVQSGEVRLKVFEYGALQDPVILVHGGPGLAGYLSELGEVLAESHRVIEYHQRGVVGSDYFGEITIAQHVEDLAAVVQHYTAETQPPIVIGHSWGGVLALTFAAQHPELIDRVVVHSPGPLDAPTTEQFHQNLKERLKNKIGYLDGLEAKIDKTRDNEEKLKLADDYLRALFSVYNTDPKPLSRVYMTPYDWDRANRVSKKYSSLRTSGYFIEQLQKIQVPIVLFHGEYDPIPHNMIFATINKYQGNAITYSYPNGGHFLWLEPAVREKFIADLNTHLRP